MIKKALIEFLLADPGVSAIVGNRIHPEKTPQGEDFPQVTLFTVDTPRVKSMDGPCGLAYPRIQIDCWALTHQQGKDLAKAVRMARGSNTQGPALNGFRGTLGNAATGRFVVQGAFVEDDRDNYQRPIHADDVGMYWISLDVVIWHEEAV